MGMQVHDLGVLQFLGVELLVDVIDHHRRLTPAGIPQRQINGFHHRKSSRGIGKKCQTQVGQARDNPVVDLIGFGERLPREVIHNHTAVGAFGDFLAPGIGQLALNMGWWEKITVGEFDGAGLSRYGTHKTKRQSNAED